jgi:hypothetical protein
MDSGVEVGGDTHSYGMVISKLTVIPFKEEH